jgi:hypothetical protein
MQSSSSSTSTKTKFTPTTLGLDHQFWISSWSVQYFRKWNSQQTDRHYLQVVLLFFYPSCEYGKKYIKHKSVQSESAVLRQSDWLESQRTIDRSRLVGIVLQQESAMWGLRISAPVSRDPTSCRATQVSFWQHTAVGAKVCSVSLLVFQTEVLHSSLTRWK